jgi:hypothetical protein
VERCGPGICELAQLAKPREKEQKDLLAMSVLIRQYAGGMELFGQGICELAQLVKPREKERSCIR